MIAGTLRPAAGGGSAQAARLSDQTDTRPWNRRDRGVPVLGRPVTGPGAAAAHLPGQDVAGGRMDPGEGLAGRAVPPGSLWAGPGRTGGGLRGPSRCHGGPWALISVLTQTVTA